MSKTKGTTNLNKLSIPVREQFIKQYPLFSLLTEEDYTELAGRVEEITVESGELIVDEGALVDSVFLIFEGRAAVTRTLITIDKTETMHIATLTAGDSIGLTEAGFFSPSGLRKAKVVASTPMQLLKLDIHQLAQFLQKPTMTYPALKSTNETIILMSFLKELPLFQHLTNEKIRQFAHHVKSVVVQPKETLFCEGDSADSCYFLLSGTVQLVTTGATQNQLIKTLEAPAMFGEGAFISNEKRNASVIAATACDLFLINKVEAINILQLKSTHIKGIQLSRIEQLRPRSLTGITYEESSIQPGKKTFLLNNSLNQSKVVLTQDEFAIWRAFDGRTTLTSIQKQLNLPSIHSVYEVVNKLERLELVAKNIQSPINFNNSSSFFKQLFNRIKNIWK